MRCPGRGGHVPWSRVLTVYRDRRGCQARPREAGSRPSSPGRTSGRFCASWVRPRDAVSIRGRLPREVRAQALEALGRRPSLVAPKRGTRDQSHRGARRGRPHAGPACLPVSARPRGRGRPRLAPPSFSRGTLKRKHQLGPETGCEGFGASAAPRDGAFNEGGATMGTDDRNWDVVVPSAGETGAAREADLPEAFDDDEAGESVGMWWARLPDFIKPDYPFDLPPERLAVAQAIFTECGVPARCPQEACRRSMRCRGGDGPPCFRADRKPLQAAGGRPRSRGRAPARPGPGGPPRGRHALPALAHASSWSADVLCERRT